MCVQIKGSILLKIEVGIRVRKDIQYFENESADEQIFYTKNFFYII